MVEERSIFLGRKWVEGSRRYRRKHAGWAGRLRAEAELVRPSWVGAGV